MAHKKNVPTTVAKRSRSFFHASGGRKLENKDATRSNTLGSTKAVLRKISSKEAGSLPFQLPSALLADLEDECNSLTAEGGISAVADAVPLKLPSKQLQRSATATSKTSKPLRNAKASPMQRLPTSKYSRAPKKRSKPLKKQSPGHPSDSEDSLETKEKKLPSSVAATNKRHSIDSDKARIIRKISVPVTYKSAKDKKQPPEASKAGKKKKKKDGEGTAVVTEEPPCGKAILQVSTKMPSPKKKLSIRVFPEKIHEDDETTEKIKPPRVADLPLAKRFLHTPRPFLIPKKIPCATADTGTVPYFRDLGEVFSLKGKERIGSLLSSVSGSSASLPKELNSLKKWCDSAFDIVSENLLAAHKNGMLAETFQFFTAETEEASILPPSVSKATTGLKQLHHLFMDMELMEPDEEYLLEKEEEDRKEKAAKEMEKRRTFALHKAERRRYLSLAKEYNLPSKRTGIGKLLPCCMKYFFPEYRKKEKARRMYMETINACLLHISEKNKLPVDYLSPVLWNLIRNENGGVVGLCGRLPKIITSETRIPLQHLYHIKLRRLPLAKADIEEDVILDTFSTLAKTSVFSSTGTLKSRSLKSRFFEVSSEQLLHLSNFTEELQSTVEMPIEAPPQTPTVPKKKKKRRKKSEEKQKKKAPVKKPVRKAFSKRPMGAKSQPLGRPKDTPSIGTSVASSISSAGSKTD